MENILEAKISILKAKKMQLELILLEDKVTRKLLANDRYLVTGVEDGWIKADKEIQEQYLESKERLKRYEGKL